MTSARTLRACTPAAPTPRPRARRRAGAGRSLLLALGIACASIGVARGDDVDTLRAGLVEGAPTTWPARMDAIAKSAEQVGAVVGPLLRDKDAAHLPVAAFAAAWLADHPSAGRVLLDEDIVRRGGADAAFVEEMRRALASDGGGWGRLVAVARGLATGPASDAPLAALAAAFLRHESTASNVRDLLDVWDRADRTELGTAARESLEFVLGATFESAGAARAFLDADRGRTLLDWVRDLSRAKDRPDAPRFRRLLAEATANLERVTTPDGLGPYLDPATTPWPEVRRLAATRAKAIDRAAPGWTALIAQSVRKETDVETLDALLRSFDGVETFEAEAAALLAQDAARSLAAREPPADGLAVGLLAVLGRLGTPELLRGVVSVLLERHASPAVLAAWLDAAAAVRGLGFEIQALYESRRTTGGEDALHLRIHALGALARGGADRDGEASASATFLASILRRRPEGSAADASPVAEERAAAARALEAFPVRASIDALSARTADVGEDAALVRLAASVLGRLAAKQARGAEGAAADALVEVARTCAVPAARISAIEDLGRLAPDGIENPGAAIEAFRAALDRGGPIELRRAGARAAAAVGDPLALAGVFALVADEAVAASAVTPSAEPAIKAAERLVRTLATGDPSRDAELGGELKELLDSSVAAVPAALALASAAADAGGGRASLQETRARLLLRAARVAGRPTQDCITDLETGRRILDAMRLGGREAAPEAPRLSALSFETVTELLRRRTAQVGEAAKRMPPDDAADLEVHRGLVDALGAARAGGLVSNAVVAAIAADAKLLASLRSSAARDVRWAALVDSARAELRLPRREGAVARARAYLDDAKRLEPSDAERRDLDGLEAELAGDGAPPTPK